jgi:hypothetical protein
LAEVDLPRGQGRDARLRGDRLVPDRDFPADGGLDVVGDLAAQVDGVADHPGAAVPVLALHEGERHRALPVAEHDLAPLGHALERAGEHLDGGGVARDPRQRQGEDARQDRAAPHRRHPMSSA